MAGVLTRAPIPADFALSTGKVLAVREAPGGAYYVRIDGANIARVDTLRSARSVFFALAAHDTAEASG